MGEPGSAGGRAAGQGGKLPPLIDALTDPDFYPDPAGAVELKQTHISYVFIAGEYVYKVKKPVRFPFLNCSTLADRYHFCVEEVRLNRRLSPDVYLGVFPILEERGRFVLGAQAHDFDPQACEYAVKMRRLPEDRMLDRLVSARAVSRDTIRALAARLAVFHGDVPAVRSWTYGSAAAIWRMIIGDLEQNQRFVGYTISDVQLATMEEHCRAYVMSHWGLLNDRAREQHVREGHGDLRCESVCITDAMVIFDCLEFSERLRYCDVASEIAFLAMDLDRLGAPALSDELVAAYAEVARDDAVRLLVPFYKCFRAAVRGKVESLRSLEEEVPAADRERAKEAAQAYFSLAYHYAQAATPALLAVYGPAGTGKSTVARLLQLRTGFEILSSDRVRKRIAGVADSARVREAYEGGIYSPDFTSRAYDTLLAEAENRLADGCGVIVDATFREPGERQRFLAMAARRGAPALFVECQAEVDEVLRRLRKRERRSDEASDATSEIYLRQLAEFAPMTAIPERSHVAIDTTSDSDRIAGRVEDALKCLLSPVVRRPVAGPNLSPARGN